MSRSTSELRPVTITPDYTDAPLASVLISCGKTQVLCTASYEDKVPGFRVESGGGWLTAEYAMLPGSSPYRVRRAISRGCAAAGVPAWSPHRLRHSAATNIRKDFGLEAAQLMLGHARADVTQIYAETNKIRGLEVAAQVG